MSRDYGSEWAFLKVRCKGLEKRVAELEAERDALLNLEAVARRHRGRATALSAGELSSALGHVDAIRAGGAGKEGA